MYTFTKYSGIHIPIEYKDCSFYKNIKDHLTRKFKNYNSDEYTILKFYKENDNELIIPRYFPINKFVSNYNISDNRPTPISIDINHNIQPRNHIQENAINFMMNNDSGMLELQPGVGKTVISIFVVATRKLKTFIIVHRDSLAEQWMDRFEQFTDLSKDDIARLTSKNYKKSLEKSVIISTTQTMNSLLKKRQIEFLSVLNKSGIGIFIGDEVHTTIGAPTFSNCSMYLPTMYNYGLSATPDRFDGNSDIIYNHVGERFIEEDTIGTVPGNITMIGFDFGLVKKSKGYLYWCGKFQRSRYLNLMRNSVNLLHVSKKILEQFVDKDILFICEYKKLIESIYSDNMLSEVDTSVFTAGVGMDALKKRITFSTPGKCRDGVDAPWKEVLVMTSPISNISQMTGRVTRSYDKNNKKSAKIVDLVDVGCKEMGTKKAIGRIKFYEERGWNIKYVLMDDNKFSVVTKLQFLNS